MSVGWDFVVGGKQDTLDDGLTGLRWIADQNGDLSAFGIAGLSFQVSIVGVMGLVESCASAGPTSPTIATDNISLFITTSLVRCG